MPDTAKSKCKAPCKPILRSLKAASSRCPKRYGFQFCKIADCTDLRLIDSCNFRGNLVHNCMESRERESEFYTEGNLLGTKLHELHEIQRSGSEEGKWKCGYQGDEDSASWWSGPSEVAISQFIKNRTEIMLAQAFHILVLRA
ncbi:hypothetical protein SS50377_27721 [Spironucleus salmonicida]|uniref:Uncharacterized protein n=1 Tax=Spironucleus salmonicida TaxID=348837 RepID=V6LJT0_9EUKA|nr:hypothetical protein SS50377_27721 [Spironucleus salmonicida]|eukprot:EST44855.1 Hypothetical protein SS50377_15251 [Spironucleus salmonicida]